MQPATSIRGVHHVGLTVPDLAAARRFFVDVLGYQARGEKPEYPAAFVSDGTTLVTLWQVKDPARSVAFDRTQNVGLHHLALAVDGHAALDALHARVAQGSDAEIEFAPEPLGGGPSRHMMLRIGGGLRIELIAAGA
jgi:catechol 2,3-dioxygenase-like lactoylglutathione lyase family enzyme